jgi:hypothetical protein
LSHQQGLSHQRGSVHVAAGVVNVVVHAAKEVAKLSGHPEEVYFCDFVSLHTSSSDDSNARNAQNQNGTAPSSIVSDFQPIALPGVLAGAEQHSQPQLHGNSTQSFNISSNGSGVDPNQHHALGTHVNISSDTQKDLGSEMSEMTHGHTVESHMLVASSESLFLWDLEAGELMQQADAPGTSGSTMPAGGLAGGITFWSLAPWMLAFSAVVHRKQLMETL